MAGEIVAKGFTAVKAKENAIVGCYLGLVVLWLSKAQCLWFRKNLF